jgi:uncharacterized radical SAM superfamily Fe-S cluster-containing enzyme
MVDRRKNADVPAQRHPDVAAVAGLVHGADLVAGPDTDVAHHVTAVIHAIVTEVEVVHVVMIGPVILVVVMTRAVRAVRVLRVRTALAVIHTTEQIMGMMWPEVNLLWVQMRGEVIG